MVEIIEGPKLAALSCGKSAYLIVLLHDDGGCGQDMIDLALGWAPGLIKADFVALEAQASWRDPESADALDAWLDTQLAARRLPDSHLALVGFGTGAELALKVGLRRREAPAALVGFAVDGRQDVCKSISAAPPVLLIQGDADGSAPYDSMLALKAALKSASIPVWSFRRPGLGHVLDADGAEAAGEFLARHVKHRAAQPA